MPPHRQPRVTMNQTLESRLGASVRGSLALTPQCAKTHGSPALARFCAALDAAYDATAGAADPSHCAEFARRIRAALLAVSAEPTLLTPRQREGSSECYRRHLLADDVRGRYALVCLVWHPGQASPVHGHQTWCGYTVVEGMLTESLYAWDTEHRCAAEARTQLRGAGAVSYTRAGMTGIHRLANESTQPAVSLHVYGVSGERIATHVNDLVAVATPSCAGIAEQARPA